MINHPEPKLFISISTIVAFIQCRGIPAVLVVKNLPANAGDKETQVGSQGQEDTVEQGMATHSSILAWIIPWAEEPGGLQSIGSQRARHN